MEPNNVDQSELLLNCIDELRRDNRSENLTNICSAMLEQHNVDVELTKSLLATLKTSAKVFTVEQKGEVVYMTIQPQKKTKKSRRDSAAHSEQKELSLALSKCVKELNQLNGEQGTSSVEILKWCQTKGGPQHLLELEKLQKALDREVSYARLKRNEAGLYQLAKKRGRPFGMSPTTKRSPKTPTTLTPKKSPDETNKRVANLGKRKRIKKSHDDFEFYDTPGNNSMQLLPASTDPICDFCLKTSSTNRKGMFEELLMCKDCNAKAHASCMGYSDILARRARLGPWQCIDCKTCCLCLDAGDPDDLLFCDACDKGYHMFCHDPAIKEKPKNKWACRTCMSDGVTADDLLALPASSVDTINDASSSQDAVFTEPNTSSCQQSNVSVGPVEEVLLPSVVSPPTTPSPESKSFLPAIPSQWSSAHVSQYIQECGFSTEAQKFLEQDIDGKSMMLLMRQDVLCHLNLKLGPALKIYEKIKVLQKSPVSKSSFD